MKTIKEKENDAIAVASVADDNTIIITSVNDEKTQAWLDNAMATYDPKNRNYSAYLNFSGTANDITQSLLESYAEGAQTNLTNIMAINTIIRKEINLDDIIGMVVQSIANNINTEYTLSYNVSGDQKVKPKMLKKAKNLIEDFNRQINIDQLIYDAVEITYCEGNYVCLLRNNKDNWWIDYLPLGIAEISGYKENGKPIILINISNLKDALQKSMIKTKKNTPLFFKDTDEEIKKNYPKEVYDAYKNKETYAKIPVDYSGVVRINNRSRKYGLSPVFRALSPMITLRSFQEADTAGAKAKSKKIIHQVLRKEVLGTDGQKKGFDIMTFAHTQFMQAFANNTVVYTSPAAVEKIEYVEPKTDDISSDKITEYRNRVLTSLGISFLATNGDLTASSANISLRQLLQSIDKISRQVEDMIEGFYETLLTTNNIDLMYKPSIRIIDSEMLEMNLRMELAKLLYTTFSCSRETALSTIGIDIEDERSKRAQENDDGYNDIFMPYPTSYNTAGNSSETGRPQDENSKDPDKQIEDKEYNKNARE